MVNQRKKCEWSNLSLKADHPPLGFFGFVSGFVAAGVGLARALAIHIRQSVRGTKNDIQ